MFPALAMIRFAKKSYIYDYPPPSPSIFPTFAKHFFTG